MTQIRLFDKDIKIAFNMATIIAYEQITDKAYNPEDLERAENRMAILYAAIIANNRGTSVEMDDLLEKASNTDIRMLDNAVSAEMLAFYKVPTPAKDPYENSGEEDLPKNV